MHQPPQLLAKVVVQGVEPKPHPRLSLRGSKAGPDHGRLGLKLPLSPGLQAQFGAASSGERCAGAQKQSPFADVAYACVEGDVVAFTPAPKARRDAQVLAVLP